jgi:hypothetical protein
MAQTRSELRGFSRLTCPGRRVKAPSGVFPSENRGLWLFVSQSAGSSLESTAGTIAIIRDMVYNSHQKSWYLS